MKNTNITTMTTFCKLSIRSKTIIHSQIDTHSALCINNRLVHKRMEVYEECATITMNLRSETIIIYTKNFTCTYSFM